MEFLVADWRERLASSNTTLVQMVRDDPSLASGYVLAAREQTAGRGRYDRQWQAKPGRDLTFSVLLRPGVSARQLISLPMAVALGVVDYLSTLGVGAQCKWPNDVLVNGRKICGILSERTDGDGIVVGIGLNVNMSPEEVLAIDRPATSIFAESGRAMDVEHVLTGLLPNLARWVEQWLPGGFAGISAAWTENCYAIGQEITVGEHGQKATGVLEGFGTDGQLLLRTSTATQEIWAGDVSTG